MLKTLVAAVAALLFLLAFSFSSSAHAATPAAKRFLEPSIKFVRSAEKATNTRPAKRAVRRFKECRAKLRAPEFTNRVQAQGAEEVVRDFSRNVYAQGSYFVVYSLVYWDNFKAFNSYSSMNFKNRVYRSGAGATAQRITSVQFLFAPRPKPSSFACDAVEDFMASPELTAESAQKALESNWPNQNAEHRAELIDNFYAQTGAIEKVKRQLKKDGASAGAIAKWEFVVHLGLPVEYDKLAVSE